MPPKRKRDVKHEPDADAIGAETSTRKETKKPTAWSSADEALLLEAVNDLVMKNLWAKVKDEPALAARMNGGVMSHWKAMYRKLVKEYVKE